MPITTINVQLALAHVGEGGNTHDGQYFYSFDPAMVNVVQSPTLLVYTLTDDVAPGITFNQIFTTDAQSQLYKVAFSKDKRSVSMLHSNTTRSLIFASMLLDDTERSTLINCDPQITNAPGDTND